MKAAKYLAEKIMPLVCQQSPNAKLAIAGASPGAAVKALATNNIIITGWLPEITTAYNESEIFIAPMQIGTGMQNKILEAMAMQIPVITSPLAAEAIGAVHNETLLIANTDNEYLNHIQSILNSSELRNKLVANGYAFVRKHYDWETNSKKLLTLISTS